MSGVLSLTTNAALNYHIDDFYRDSERKKQNPVTLTSIKKSMYITSHRNSIKVHL